MQKGRKENAIGMHLFPLTLWVEANFLVSLLDMVNSVRSGFNFFWHGQMICSVSSNEVMWVWISVVHFGDTLLTHVLQVIFFLQERVGGYLSHYVHDTPLS